jgi:hypothetical protein
MSTMMPTCSTAPEAAPKASAAEADLKNFLQKRYDADLAKSAVTYETHVMASRGLHEAQQHLMKTKRMMQRLESELSDLREAKAAAVDATAAVDRKRKAAADAEDDFNADIRFARHCYGIRCAALEKAEPVPVGDGGETPSYAPEPALNLLEVPTRLFSRRPDVSRRRDSERQPVRVAGRLRDAHLRPDLGIQCAAGPQLWVRLPSWLPHWLPPPDRRPPVHAAWLPPADLQADDAKLLSVVAASPFAAHGGCRPQQGAQVGPV